MKQALGQALHSGDCEITKSDGLEFMSLWNFHTGI